MIKISKKTEFKLLTCILMIFVAVDIFPIYWMFVLSTTTRQAALTNPSLIPTLDLSVYLTLFGFEKIAGGLGYAFTSSDFIKYYLNSSIICFSAAGLSMIIGSLAAYSLARFKIRGGENIAFWILSIRMMPPIATVIPLFLMFNTLHLLDTYHGLILVYTGLNLPFVVWMMRGFFEEVPVDLEESAMVDGCSRLNAFFRVVLPLTLPGIVATIVFVLIMSWNEFLLALVLTGTTTRTLPVGIQTFMTTGVMGTYQWPQIGAAGIAASVPIIAFAIIIQKYLVRGLTLGAVKR